MHIFREPPERQVRRLLGGTNLPAADLTPEHLEHFFGCGSEQAPQGGVGLEIYGSVALLRSLAVDESARGRGVRRMYLLTTTAEKFFARLGYSAVARDGAPESIRATAEFSSLCPSSSAFMAKSLDDSKA